MWLHFTSGGLPSSASFRELEVTSLRGEHTSLCVVLTLPSYLVLYMWKEHCKKEGKDMFSDILSLVSMKQREKDAEHPMAKVFRK